MEMTARLGLKELYIARGGSRCNGVEMEMTARLGLKVDFSASLILAMGCRNGDDSPVGIERCSGRLRYQCWHAVEMEMTARLGLKAL